jgi:anthranilate synthase component 1
MLKPDLNEFEKLRKTGDFIPVFRELIGDLETPVSILARLADAENLFLLESVEGGERFGRYSFLGLNARAVFEIKDGKPFLTEKGVRRELPFDGNPLHALRGVIGGVRPVEYPGLPPFFGGAVGFLGYEVVNLFEELPPPKAPVDTPDAVLMITDEIIVFDNVRHTIKLLVGVRPSEFADSTAAYEHARRRIAALEETLRQPMPSARAEKAAAQPKLSSNMNKEEFCDMIEKARRYIHDGEAIQIVLSQKFSAPAVSSPLQLYRALRLINPSPYMFFVKLGGLTLVGSSPETMVKLENGRSSLRPIAGTRKRSADMLEDMRLADELLRDEKERAEHLMLVDLGRNDLGRTARPGSVQVKAFMTVERYSHVMHLVSDVDALLRPECDAFDLVSSVFPAGTLSGAPKIRAMELINELEKEPRGVYGGAVGYFGYNGNMDMAITIRTLAVKDGMLSIQAGAGIVHDSKPEAEYEETLNKAAALFKAVKLAANGLEME